MARKFIKNLYHWYLENAWIRYFAVFVSSFFVFAWVESYPSFPDPDSFYHLGVTQEMLAHGLVKNFHWLQFTTLKTIYIDHHLLYHIVLMPFVYFLEPFFAMKLATVLLGAGCITALFCLIRSSGGKYPELFVALALTSSPLLFRLGLPKASAFAITLLLLGLAVMVRKRYLALFIISLLYVFSHGGFILILLFAGLYVLTGAIHDYFFGATAMEKFLHRLPFFRIKAKNFFKLLFQREHLTILLTVVSALVVGIIFSPYFPTNIAFLREQLIQIGIFTKTDIRVGGEWFPYDPLDLLYGTIVIFSFYCLACVAFIVDYKKQSKEAYFFLFSSLIFIILTSKSRRFIEYLVPLALIFISTVAAHVPRYGRAFLMQTKKLPDYARNFLIFVLLAPLAFIPFIVRRDFVELKGSVSQGIPFQRFAGVGAWLKENTKPGEIIFHTDWSDFPMLFYQDRQNDYIVGLDPTFMYNVDPALYELYANITLGKKAAGISDALVNIFHTRYFIVNSGRDQLTKNLQKEGKWIKVYSDSDAAIYRLK